MAVKCRRILGENYLNGELCLCRMNIEIKNAIKGRYCGLMPRQISASSPEGLWTGENQGKSQIVIYCRKCGISATMLDLLSAILNLLSAILDLLIDLKQVWKI